MPCTGFKSQLRLRVLSISGDLHVRQELAEAASTAALKSAPPVAVVTATTIGAIDMTWLVGAVTVGYVLLQAAYLLWKWRREARAKSGN